MWWCRGWMGQEGVACWHVIRDPSRSASGTFHVLVGVQGRVPKAVLWWSWCAVILKYEYVDLFDIYIDLGVPSGPAETLRIGRTRGYVVAGSIL